MRVAKHNKPYARHAVKPNTGITAVNNDALLMALKRCAIAHAAISPSAKSPYAPCLVKAMMNGWFISAPPTIAADDKEQARYTRQR